MYILTALANRGNVEQAIAQSRAHHQRIQAAKARLLNGFEKDYGVISSATTPNDNHRGHRSGPASVGIDPLSDEQDCQL